MVRRKETPQLIGPLAQMESGVFHFLRAVATLSLFFFFLNIRLVVISTFCWTQEVRLLPFIKMSGGQISKGARQYERTFFSVQSLKWIANESPPNVTEAACAPLMMCICEASLGVRLHLHHYKLCNYSLGLFRLRHREPELQQQVSCLGFLPGAWVTVQTSVAH